MRPWIQDSEISVAALLETPEGREKLHVERIISGNELLRKRAPTKKQNKQLADYRAKGRKLARLRELEMAA